MEIKNGLTFFEALRYADAGFDIYPEVDEDTGDRSYLVQPNHLKLNLMGHCATYQSGIIDVYHTKSHTKWTAIIN